MIPQRLNGWLKVVVAGLLGGAIAAASAPRNANAQLPSSSPAQPNPSTPSPSLPSASPPQLGNYPQCQPPGAAEYLLLIITRTPENQAQTQQLLPPSTSVMTCAYLNETVTRVGGFRTVERANAWAKYITDTTGFAAFVARPAENPPRSTASPSTAPPTAAFPNPSSAAPSASPVAKASPATDYNPRPLEAGYAVLVDYANKPEVASQVQRVLGDREIGLVAYSQRPYLLATYTTDVNAANTTLRTLKARGFSVDLVDSRRVVLLKQSVTLSR